MVQLAQLMPACRAWRRVGKPVATMVPSRDDMNKAMETMAKISHGARASWPRSVTSVAAVATGCAEERHCYRMSGPYRCPGGVAAPAGARVDHARDVRRQGIGLCALR